MKNLILLAVCALIALCSDGQSMPNELAKKLEKCDCKVKYFGPVCSKKGKNYLNDCIAKCMGAKLQKDQENCTVDSLPKDTLTWPIHNMCVSLATTTTPKAIRMLADGSLLYERQKSVNFNAEGTGTYFRGGHNTCRCLPGTTSIATPNGEILVSQLKKGDLVYTQNDKGVKVEAPITELSRVGIAVNHQFLEIGLEDGRELRISPLHPDPTYLPLSSLELEGTLDGAKVISLKTVPATVSHTFDILPQGTTGVYWANGVLVGSTLKQIQSVFQAVK